MGAIYLVNILHKIYKYSKYISKVTIILRPFMIIIILEYMCNMVIHTQSKYTFVNPNIPNYIFLNTQYTPLYTHRVLIKFMAFATNGT